MSGADSLTGPLHGIRVVDLSQVLSGPFAAAILADQGAEVIKVETPAGDPARSFGPAKGDLSAMFIAANRGKRAVCLDLKTEAGCAALTRLIERADVLVENFRPGAMERLGFGYDRCRELNPKIIFASITGFGPDGPYTNIRVYDPVVQAVSGMAATQSDHEGKPSLVRSLVCDKLTGLTAAQAITAALFHRERTGEGQRVDVAMLDAAVAFNWPDGMFNHSFQDDPPPYHPEYGDLVRLSKAADGHVAASALQGVEFAALMRSLDLHDLAGDARFETFLGRIANLAEWTGPMQGALAGRSCDELMDGFIREGAVGGRVNAQADVHADRQVVHNQTIAEIDQPGAGRVRVARHPSRFGATPARVPGAAPHLGEHNVEVLAELGLSESRPSLQTRQP